MTAPQQERQGNASLKALEAYIAYRSLRHSEDQEAVAAGLVAKMTPLWMIQQFNDLDSSTPHWVESVIPFVKTAYQQSQRLAAVYANDIRNATLATADPLPMVVPSADLPAGVPVGRFNADLIPSVSTDPAQPVVQFDEFPIQDVRTSLIIQGNYNIKAQMPAPEAEAMQTGSNNSAGAAVRQAMNGGRNVTNNLVKFDRRIIGYARYTDSDPCFFCAVLASRGAVYTKNSTQGGRFIAGRGRTKGDADFKPNPNGAQDLPDGFIPAKVHDHCRCTLRPVYSKSQAMDADAKFYKKQWDDAMSQNYGERPEVVMNYFREHYKPYERPAPTLSDIRDELQERADALSQAGFPQIAPQSEWTHRQLSQLA